MKKTIITISREFGSGGRTIGHQVAEKLGYPYYDKELIKTVAENATLASLKDFVKGLFIEKKKE